MSRSAPAIRPHIRHDPIRLAVLISGAGTTLANLARHIESGELRAEISVVIASNDTAAAAGLERARERDIPAFVVPRKGYDSVEAFSDHLFSLVRDARADLVCMAGFLSLIRIPDDYAHNVINIHPALLPAFGGQGMYGRHVHEAVLAHGCKITGCTVHFADQEYDRGPILIQQACPVADEDTPETLAARVAEQEAQAYPRAVRLIAQRRVTIENHRTRIACGDAAIPNSSAEPG